MAMMIHWRVLLVERIFVNISVMILVIGYHIVNGRRNVRGKVGRSLPRLVINQPSLLKHEKHLVLDIGNLPVSRQYWFSGHAFGRN